MKELWASKIVLHVSEYETINTKTTRTAWFIIKQILEIKYLEVNEVGSNSSTL